MRGKRPWTAMAWAQGRQERRRDQRNNRRVVICSHRSGAHHRPTSGCRAKGESRTLQTLSTTAEPSFLLLAVLGAFQVDLKSLFARKWPALFVDFIACVLPNFSYLSLQCVILLFKGEKRMYRVNLVKYLVIFFIKILVHCAEECLAFTSMFVAVCSALSLPPLSNQYQHHVDFCGFHGSPTDEAFRKFNEGEKWPREQNIREWRCKWNMTLMHFSPVMQWCKAATSLTFFALRKQ